MWQNRGFCATTRARVFWTRWRRVRFETNVPARGESCRNQQESTQPLVISHHQAVVYPWVFVDWMSFLASFKYRLEKRLWLWSLSSSSWISASTPCEAETIVGQVLSPEGHQSVISHARVDSRRWFLSWCDHSTKNDEIHSSVEPSVFLSMSVLPESLMLLQTRYQRMI